MLLLPATSKKTSKIKIRFLSPIKKLRFLIRGFFFVFLFKWTFILAIITKPTPDAPLEMLAVGSLLVTCRKFLTFWAIKCFLFIVLNPNEGYVITFTRRKSGLMLENEILSSYILLCPTSSLVLAVLKFSQWKLMWNRRRVGLFCFGFFVVCLILYHGH